MLTWYVVNFSYCILADDVNCPIVLKIVLFLKKMIYLISHISSIFLTQIDYHMNFITSLSISSQGFPGTLISIFGGGLVHKKMHISEYVCRTCLKELGIRNGIEIFKLLIFVLWKIYCSLKHLKILLFHNFYQRFLTTVF